MAYEIVDYRIEPYDSPSWDKRPKTSRLTVYTPHGQEVYDVEQHNAMIIEDGKIVSISGNGCSRDSFDSAGLRVRAFRAWDKRKEFDVLKTLRDIVCNGNDEQHT